MKSPRWCRIALLLALALNSLPVFAHKESDAYLTLRNDRADSHVLEGQWDIALRDLDFALGIDSNHDGKITWGEARAHRTAIESYALPRLAIKGDGLTCECVRPIRKSTTTPMAHTTSSTSARSATRISLEVRGRLSPLRGVNSVWIHATSRSNRGPCACVWRVNPLNVPSTNGNREVIVLVPFSTE